MDQAGAWQSNAQIPRHDVTEDDDTAPAEGESWTNPFSEEFDRRKEELLAMPGFQLKADLEALGRAGRVNYKNQQELVRHAGLFLNSGRHYNTMTDEYEDELVRFLHNYLTSVTSLRDSQYVVMRHRWGNQSEFETGTYTTQRKATFATGEAEFMSKLRNYCTHRSIPVPGMVTTLTGERGRPPRFVNELNLDRDGLLDWDGWNEEAKAYLKAKDPQFDLLPVIESYMNATAHFFNWFTVEINKQCATLRDEYLTAAHALKNWYEEEMGMNTEGYRKLFGPSSGGNQGQRRGQRQQPKRATKRKRRKK